MKLLFFTLLYFIATVNGLDNGLALKPPMGWLSWARFTCVTDCSKYPDTCIHENLYKQMGEKLIEDGYLELGYDIVAIDDCWSELERDNATGRLVADRKRFPSGIKALADWMHSKGLRLGIYGDVGSLTCAGYPGQNGPGEGFFEIDAQTFAEWGVDALKFDGCYEDPANFDTLYPKMSTALNKTGAAIIYHCEWPLYQFNANITPNYDAISRYCNMYRNHDDVLDSWQSVSSIIQFYGDHQDTFIPYNGPGMWLDPDMLVIGDYGLSENQWQTQMSFWSMWSSPLYMSNDLRRISDSAKKILKNSKVIEVNQDPLGKMARRMVHDAPKDRYFEAWTKEMQPRDGKTVYAVVYYNNQPLGNPEYFSVPLSTLLPKESSESQFEVVDLWETSSDYANLGTVKGSESLELLVHPSGGSRMVLLTKTS
uniref:Alpha-galactosidase n=1 Tax=Tetranychus truncatus TaxID=93132 RepID=A0A3G5ANV7_9ACAR|nr:hypothetical protein [Tetranychus truncatus]